MFVLITFLKSAESRIYNIFQKPCFYMKAKDILFKFNARIKVNAGVLQ